MVLHRDATKLPDELLDSPVQGRNLAGTTLRSALGEGPTLLLFLRHLG